MVNLQDDQAKLNNINKRQFSVERELTKAEMIIDDLRIMINGTKQQEDRIKSVADLLTSTFDDLMHVGKPLYHRPNRKVEDQLCMTVLTAFQESLIDASFVDSAGKAITAIQSWFDADMPKTVQEEIGAFVYSITDLRFQQVQPSLDIFYILDPLRYIFILACWAIPSFVMKRSPEVLRGVLGKSLFNRSNDSNAMSVRSWRKGNLHTWPIHSSRRRICLYQNLLVLLSL